MTPEDEATGVETTDKVVISFSEPLDPASVEPNSVQVRLGDAAIEGTLEYADNRVTFTPAQPLSLLGQYTVSVGTDVHDAEGAALLEPFSSTFEARDGSWKPAIDVTGPASYLSPTLPMSATGEVLAAWSGAGDDSCPTSARRFRRGSPTPAVSFPFDTSVDNCGAPFAAGNAEGIFALAWLASAGPKVQQYREAAWLATPKSLDTTTDPDIVVSPAGAVSYFVHGATALSALRTDATGAWAASADAIASGESVGRVSAAFDGQGTGLLVSLQKGAKDDRIVASRFADGKWGTAATVSTASTGTLGRPTVAFDSAGDAIALWVAGAQLRASRYTAKSSAWGTPVPVGVAATVNVLRDPPALVFDGKDFVAAWVADDADSSYTYTARYSASTGWDAPARRQTTAVAYLAGGNIMPRLTSDGRGNLVLVWLSGSASAYKLVSQRFARGEWGAIVELPGGDVNCAEFQWDEFNRTLPFSGNAQGLAAITWVNTNSSPRILGVRLASFY